MAQQQDMTEQLCKRLLQIAEKLENRNNETMDAAGQFLNMTSGQVQKILTRSRICFDPEQLHPDSQDIDLIQDYMVHMSAFWQ